MQENIKGTFSTRRSQGNQREVGNTDKKLILLNSYTIFFSNSILCFVLFPFIKVLFLLIIHYFSLLMFIFMIL